MEEKEMITDEFIACKKEMWDNWKFIEKNQRKQKRIQKPSKKLPAKHVCKISVNFANSWKT